MDLQTLQFWHKLEHFYPYILREQKSQSIQTFLIGDPLPFPDFENPRIEEGKHVRGYHVYLGIFRVAPALEALEKGIGKKMCFRDCGKEESCFCKFQLSPNGIAQPESFQISSFPWAIHRVRDGKINMDQWDDDFFSFQKETVAYLTRFNTPVNYNLLCEFRDWLARQMNWMVDYSDIWLRIDMTIGQMREEDSAFQAIAHDSVEIDEEGISEEEDEEILGEDDTTDEQIKRNDLLNSFYAKDLERVIKQISDNEQSCSEALRQYIAPTVQNSERIDIEKDRDTLFQLMSPELLPMGRWPSNHGSRLMQQVNVNAFLSEETDYMQPLFSVNGPPGTGKTTLLKDVIAAIVTMRADTLSTLETPNAAFESNSIGYIQAGSYRNNIWKLRPEFSDYGILVTSNNNGAVENITLELPEKSEIPERYHGSEYHYFSSVSDRLLGKDKTWALNAAALGNKRNRRNFADAFWPLKSDPESYNFRLELKKRSRQFNMQDWHEAKACYREKRAAVEQEFQRIKHIYLCADELRKLRKELPKLKETADALELSIATAQKILYDAEQELLRTQSDYDMLSAQLDELRRTRSFFGIRLFLNLKDPVLDRYRTLSNHRDRIVCEVLPIHRDNKASASQHLTQLQNELQENQRCLEQCEKKISELTDKLEEFREQTNSPCRIDAYFERCDDGETEKNSPWGYKRLNELREQLFLSALKLHEAFVSGSTYMVDNLDGFSKVLRGITTEAQSKQFFAPLLQSFFMLVPVVSTTFASVGSFLRHIPASEIGYLFIDEAGQATPQSAVGAIWRARKVIAVGDPLQIEPVVTLHDSIIHALADHFGQEDILRDKYISVQTLGDRANRIGGRRTLFDPNDLWIGAPLTVHNRCQRTVFRIANRIAYNDKMIFATREQPNAVCRWLDVHGASEWEHYVPAQAENAMKIATDIFSAFAEKKEHQDKYPSLFIITPFCSVRTGIANYFKQNLYNKLRDNGVQMDQKQLKEWIRTCIGTIHTFQGKEADTVILCLGVDSDGSGIGAVEWAAERPNILNVAVTRSKRDLFILGDQSIWCRNFYFQTARDFCQDT